MYDLSWILIIKRCCRLIILKHSIKRVFLIWILISLMLILYSFLKTQTDSEYQVQESWAHQTKTLRFTKMSFGPAYILGVAVGNSSTNNTWDIVKVYGTVGSLTKAKFCCVRYGSTRTDKYYKQPVIFIKRQHIRTRLTASHFTCENPESGRIPKGISFTHGQFTCGDEHVTYLEPIVPLVEAESKLALSTKVAYGNQNPELIIEWMETYLFLGVDKVVTYYLNDLNLEARNVLEYYTSVGKLEVINIELAAEGEVNRSFSPADNQCWSDETAIVFDVFERLIGYTYFGIIDHDEFLIPSRNRSLKQFVDDLFTQHSRAPGFTVHSQMYYHNWPEHGTATDLIIGRSITKVKDGLNFHAQKNIYKPQYVAYGGASTHFPALKPGFKMRKVPPEEGYIHHFRHCHSSDCLEDLEREDDPWLSEWSRQIEKNVHKVRRIVFQK